MKRREVKSKGEKEKYKHLNAEFQRIAQRDKKPSSVTKSKKWKKTIEWERLEIYLFQKIRDTKKIFYANLGSIKDRNGMDVTEAEDIKKRWQKYTEECQEPAREIPPMTRSCGEA